MAIARAKSAERDLCVHTINGRRVAVLWQDEYLVHGIELPDGYQLPSIRVRQVWDEGSLATEIHIDDRWQEARGTLVAAQRKDVA